MTKHSYSKQPALSAEEYLRNELEAREMGKRVGYEYVAGELYAMSPITERHDTITDNIRHHLRAATRAAKCRMLGDVLTRVADDRYYYPDVIITCAPLSPAGLIVAPCFVVEVTSPSTRTTDMREKPLAYRHAPTMQGFLIVEQRRRLVLAHSRRADGSWEKVEFAGSGTIDIPCIDAQLTVDQIYETLEFPARVREDEFTTEEYGGEWVLVRADAVS